MSKFSVDESKSGTLLERALNHATRERVFVAPRVVQSGHSRCGGSTKGLREISSDYSVYKRVRVSERTSRLNSNSKSLETVASFKKIDLDYALSDVAVGGGGVEAIFSENVRVELGDGYHGCKIVVELRREVAGTSADAVFEILLAFDLVLQAHCDLQSEIMDGSRKVAVNLELEPAANNNTDLSTASWRNFDCWVTVCTIRRPTTK